MNPAEQILAQMADIHTTKPEFMWLAPGWWLVIILLCITLGGLLYVLIAKFKKRRVKTSLRSQLNQELITIEQQWQTNKNIIQASSQLHTLIKRYLLLFITRNQLAAIGGEQLLEQLQKVTNNEQLIDKYAAIFCQIPYQNPNREISKNEFRLRSQQIEQFIGFFKQQIHQLSNYPSVLVKQSGDKNV